MNPIVKHFQELAACFGAGWNRFWFRPADPLGVCVLRVFAGLPALWYLLSHTSDLVTWFGPHGLLPIHTVQQLEIEPDGQWNARASYLYSFDDPDLLWIAHLVGIGVLVAFTAGLASRVTSVLALGVVLSYVHRAPAITGQFEPILTMLMFYLCWSPCGRVLSADSWLRRIRARRSKPLEGRVDDDAPSLAAGVCMRLIQVHVAGLYLMMGLTKLGGSNTWWIGEAMWWLIAHTESRLVDLTWLAGHEYLIGIWSHCVVGLEITFALFVWNRLTRPLLLAASVVHWILIGLITGLLSFAAAMLVVNVAFVSPGTLRRLGFQAWPVTR